MNLLKIFKHWKNRKSEVNNIIIMSSGGFYLDSKYLFKNKKETLNLLKKLNMNVKIKK